MFSCFILAEKKIKTALQWNIFIFQIGKNNKLGADENTYEYKHWAHLVMSEP